MRVTAQCCVCVIAPAPFVAQLPLFAGIVQLSNSNPWSRPCLVYPSYAGNDTHDAYSQESCEY